ncbi:BON domain-containing protein [Cupriavidus necator]|uniref:BON domain-containing protein n=1 Tax=Cupriavidus necator TaxID=106590 RepID=UPI00148FE088|nr:BON domain-containing protein [Cupriavidus necator]NOV24825.1 BON domain-containing protein [Cupriavidus necator]
MFNFRNDRGSRGRPEAQRRDHGPEQRMRDESEARGSEDWGQEWGEDWRGQGSQPRGEYGGYASRAQREDSRADEHRGQGRGMGSERESSRHGGPWYEQDTPAGQRRGSWGERGYGAADVGGSGHPYSSAYGGYRPSPQDSGYRSEERESGYGYRDEDRFGPRGRRSEASERNERYERDERNERNERDPRSQGGWGAERGRSEGGRAMHWQEGSERDRAQRGGQPSYGGGYFGDAGRGGQSFSGGQRVYPDDPGYRRRSPHAGQAGASGAQGGQHAGRRATGPKGYRRSDERVREDVCERLAMNPYIDVGEVTVEVANGVVTLDGTVSERREKYVVEEIADAVFGVTEVDNRLRVQRQQGSAWAAGSEVGGDTSTDTSDTASAGGTSPDRTLNKS